MKMKRCYVLSYSLCYITMTITRHLLSRQDEWCYQASFHLQNDQTVSSHPREFVLLSWTCQSFYACVKLSTTALNLWWKKAVGHTRVFFFFETLRGFSLLDLLNMCLWPNHSHITLLLVWYCLYGCVSPVGTCSTHTHTHTVWAAILVGTLHRCYGFVQTVFSIALHQPYT